MKLTLELNTKQLGVLQAALDLYSRTHMGQYTDLPNSKNEFTTSHEDEQVIKSILFPELHANGYYGIHSDKISDSARVAWDLQQVIRYQWSWLRMGKIPGKDQRDWHGENSMMGVSYDEPRQSSETEPLAKITLDNVERWK